MYPIQEKFIKFNRSNKPLSIKGAVLHETANPGDSALLEWKYFNSGDRQASAHAFVDALEIIQFVPWTEQSWHAGRTANRQFIGVEMCHTLDGQKFEEIWKKTVWLFGHIFTKIAMPAIYTVTPFNLMSHAEVSNAWKETDHMDPISYINKYGKTMYTFRKEVQESINDFLFVRAVNCKQLISTPEYWLANCKPGVNINGAWTQRVIQNYVAMFRNAQNMQECFDVLESQKVITNRQYWKDNATQIGIIDGGNMRSLLVNMGKNL